MEVVIVDYSIVFKVMLGNANLSGIDHNILDERFLPKGKGKQKFQLDQLQIDKNATDDEAEAIIKSEGFEPAKIEHLLALLKANTHRFVNFSFQKPLVILGSRCLNDEGFFHCVPILRNPYWAGKFMLDIEILSPKAKLWGDWCNFLVIKP
ncbi:MAG: hypothetical protein A2Y67_00100 [Candidatus Buchananbacteria bacterium RBG_13_39_9]|uniref:Uncharacterized protein n=1 Tax=Candidatus Buchananbacteria bacterium RBG_13_39_9 TaxID=1797531 RepID=A0A1G1XSC1_9BACT|nr:MAG: hypothetical protein A2Y67_00100 [Candidatus Buchananbacteria bacterium RBG_13_39_9]